MEETNILIGVAIILSLIAIFGCALVYTQMPQEVSLVSIKNDISNLKTDVIALEILTQTLKTATINLQDDVREITVYDKQIDDILDDIENIEDDIDDLEEEIDS